MRTFKSTQHDMQARIVCVVRRGLMTSRVAPAQDLEIAPSTLGIHVDQLVQRGVLTQSCTSLGPGCPAKQLLQTLSTSAWFASG